MKRRAKPNAVAATPKPAPLPIAGPTGVRGKWLIAAGLVLVTALTYLPVLKCDFVDLDDQVYVTANPALELGLSGAGWRWAWTAVVSGHWHPLTLLSLLLDHELFGEKPWGYHLVNLMLHLANTLLLYRCLCVLTGAVWRSAGVAALFALHPIHVESVAWVTERKDVLGTFFLLLALRAYAWYVAALNDPMNRVTRGRRMAVVALCFVLSLLAKSMWVTFPFALLLLDYWPLRRVGPALLPVASWKRVVVEKWWLFGVVAVFLVTTMWSQKWRAGAVPSEASLEPLWVRGGNAFLSYFNYLRQTLVPVDLAPLYPYPGKGINIEAAVGAAVFVLAASVIAIMFARRLPYLFVGWFWYVGMLVPGIGIVQVGNLARADHFTYVPLIGIFLLATWGVADLLRRVPLLSPLTAGVVLSLCTFATVSQIDYWKNSLALWEHTVRVTSNNFAAHRAFGLCLLQKDRYAEALEQFDAGLKLWQNDPKASEGRGQALLALGRDDEAFDAFQKAVTVEPDLATSHYYLGRIYFKRGQAAEAEKSFQTALKYAPRSADTWYDLGVCRLRRKDFAGAEDALSRAAYLMADQPELREKAVLCRLARGEALLALDRVSEAVPLLCEAADAFADTGRFREAAAIVQGTLQNGGTRLPPATVHDLTERRECYVKGQPYRTAQ